MRWVVIGAAAALVGLLAYGVASQGDGAAAAEVRKGERAPAANTALPRLGDATKATLADYRGQVVLVNFWASWCPPCTDELPLLQKAQTALERSGATVVGINSRDNSEDALAWMDRHRLTYPSLRDGSGDYAEQWGVFQMPESYLLGRDGRVVALLKGPLTQAWIDEHVTPLARRS